MTVSRLTLLFDRLARIAANSVAAPVTIITLRNSRSLRVVGSYGTYVGGGWETAKLPVLTRAEHQSSAIEYIPSIKSWRDVARLPLVDLAPYVRRLVSVPVPLVRPSMRASIIIGQPSVRWPIDVHVNTVLRDLASLVGEEIEDSADRRTVADVNWQRFDENPAATYVPEDMPDSDSAGNFLLATLKSRTNVRNRGGVSYIVFRTWASPIKSYQIKALEVIKRRPHATTVASVATEIISGLQKLISIRTLNCVVPVPCGHSKGEACFSVRLAGEVATRLRLPLANVLTQPRRPGKSHPRKNAQLALPGLKSEERLGNVLLIDDVATSGRHIELAMKRLETQANHVTALAWIGA